MTTTYSGITARDRLAATSTSRAARFMVWAYDTLTEKGREVEAEWTYSADGIEVLSLYAPTTRTADCIQLIISRGRAGRWGHLAVYINCHRRPTTTYSDARITTSVYA